MTRWIEKERSPTAKFGPLEVIRVDLDRRAAKRKENYQGLQDQVHPSKGRKNVRHIRQGRQLKVAERII